MIDKIRKYIKKENMLNAGDKIVAGISGGADSVCLLYVLYQLKNDYDLDILAVHVNHNLRDTAMRDQLYVEQLCRNLSVPFVAQSVNVNELANKEHLSTEEAARLLRYKAFEDAATAHGFTDYKVAVAHNMNDNAETIILNMARGTGLKGLCGILPSRDNIIRPLRFVTRAEIEAYLEDNKITFCTDETNLTNDYSRNKVRHNIIPELNAINENSVDRINELSEQMILAEDYISQVTNDALTKFVSYDAEDILVSEDILKIHQYIMMRVLHESIGLAAGKKKDIGAIHIRLLAKLFNNQVGKTISLPYGVKATRDYNSIRISKENELVRANQSDILQIIELAIPGETLFNNFKVNVSIVSKESILSLSDNGYESLNRNNEKYFDYDKIQKEFTKQNQKLVLRYRNDGDHICINDSGQKKKIKDYMVNEKIPSRLRDSIAMLAIGSEIIWVNGYRDSSAYRVDGNTDKVMKIFIEHVSKEE